MTIIAIVAILANRFKLFIIPAVTWLVPEFILEALIDVKDNCHIPRNQ